MGGWADGNAYVGTLASCCEQVGCCVPVGAIGELVGARRQQGREAHSGGSPCEPVVGCREAHWHPGMCATPHQLQQKQRPKCRRKGGGVAPAPQHSAVQILTPAHTGPPQSIRWALRR